MNFGLALNSLKHNLRVARKGWNGKGMWLYLHKPLTYQHLPFIMMKTADDMFVPWLASQTDILAEDWEVID